MTRRIIVCGCRDWQDRAAVVETLNATWGYNLDRETLLVHGGCKTGVDAIASEWASRVGVPQEIHPADWSAGRIGGPLRNRKMAGLPGVEFAIAFWDGNSRGTASMIAEAVRAGLRVNVIPKAPAQSPPPADEPAKPER